jgi:hypothetical protein
MASRERLASQGQENYNRNIDFTADVAELADALVGRVIMLEGTNKRVRVDSSEAWPVAERENLRAIGGRYRDVLISDAARIGVGEVWAAPQRQSTQFIIAGLDNGQRGACVRVTKVSRYDAESKSFIPLANEGDLAKYFDIAKHELLRLSVTENSNSLRLSRTGDKINPDTRTRVNMTNDADRLLYDLLES